MVSPAVLGSAKEISEFLKSQAGPFDIMGSDTKRHFRIPRDTPGHILTVAVQGIIEFDVQDQVVIVGSGMPIVELQGELLKHDQMLPMPSGLEIPIAAAGYTGTVGGSLSMNLPHAAGGLTGSWRDWVLGMTVVLASGEIVKCGSKAVKSVAGYDLQKLFIGARGTLGVVVDVTLRTYPLRAFEKLRFDWEFRGPRVSADSSADWIQRTRRTDFEEALNAASQYSAFADRSSSTLWACLPAGVDLPRFDSDWVLRSCCGKQNVEVPSGPQRALMANLRSRMDPSGLLNRGEFTFL